MRRRCVRLSRIRHWYHIGAFYDLEKGLKELPPKEREKERQTSIEPLVEAYFAWVKKTLREGKVPPKSETASGLRYSLNQEKYLRVFLRDGEVPIDNSACERALKNFTIGRKNWVIMNTVRGAQASAMIYSVTETARANDLNVYYYIRHLLTELSRHFAARRTLREDELETLMPWSKTLPEECYKKRRE